jgi:energy-converting hydrogenase A subunit M
MSWTEIRNRLIQDMALNIGVNISTLASFLNDSTARTAREISTEENDTAEYVNDERSTLEKPINRILKLVLLYKGFKDDVVIRWSSAGLTNRHSLAEILSIALNSSKPFVSQKKAVEMFNYDDDDVQVWEEFEQIKADEDAQEQGFNDTNYFGEKDDSEQTFEFASADDRGSGNEDKDIG